MSYENEAELRKRTLGRYRLLRRIGHGGMGEVWLAEDPSLYRQIAINILLLRDQDDQQALLRFAREARAIATLHHPHILPVHDYGKQEEPDGQVMTYIVMPYVAGGSLADRIAARTSSIMPQHEAINYLAQAAEAIDYAHRHGIIHRDVKPQNLLLRDGTWLLLADFGLAYSVLVDEQITTSGIGFGTPDYMSPEQAQGKAEMASDIYSLAVLAYQLFTGRLPFHGETSYATIVQHITMAPPPPRQFNPALSAATETVLLRGLAKTVGERPSSALAFISELQQTLADAQFAPTLSSNEELIPTLAKRPAGVDAPETYVKPSPRETPREIQRKTLLTRRNVLLGGATLVAAGAGLSTWAVAANQTKKPVVSPSPTALPGSTDRPIVLLGHNRAVSPLVWSPQGSVLASADSSGNRQVLLWDMQQILTEQIMPVPYKAKQSLNSVTNLLLAWSPDGKALAIG
ncbi:MAG: protein kinase, partial [Ktedonobacteraceae bacterium]|nr:protein kinase [Ktedonobacteraceae bacterium]